MENYTDRQILGMLEKRIYELCETLEKKIEDLEKKGPDEVRRNTAEIIVGVMFLTGVGVFTTLIFGVIF